MPDAAACVRRQQSAVGPARRAWRWPGRHWRGGARAAWVCSKEQTFRRSKPHDPPALPGGRPPLAPQFTSLRVISHVRAPTIPPDALRHRPCDAWHGEDVSWLRSFKRPRLRTYSTAAAATAASLHGYGSVRVSRPADTGGRRYAGAHSATWTAIQDAPLIGFVQATPHCRGTRWAARRAVARSCDSSARPA